MTKSAGTSSATVSSTSTDSSAESKSDDALDFDLERDIPTTAEDVRVLRALRTRTLGVNLLPRIDELFASLELETFPPRRTTSEGWEEFTLED